MELGRKNRKPAPLPTHINAYFVAGSIEFEKKQNLTRKVIGDYLVSIKSALGEHPNPRFQLKLPESHKAVFYGLNHFQLQYHPSVAEQLVKWFYPAHEEVPEQQIHEFIGDWSSLEGIALT